MSSLIGAVLSHKTNAVPTPCLNVRKACICTKAANYKVAATVAPCHCGDGRVASSRGSGFLPVGRCGRVFTNELAIHGYCQSAALSDCWPSYSAGRIFLAFHVVMLLRRMLQVLWAAADCFRLSPLRRLSRVYVTFRKMWSRIRGDKSGDIPRVGPLTRATPAHPRQIRHAQGAVFRAIRMLRGTFT